MSGTGVERSVRCGKPPWIVSDELWDRLEPLLPRRERRFRYPGRRPLPDRAVLRGILYVLHTGIQWEYLPRDLGFGSGMTCRRRLRDWNKAGVRQRLHEVLLAGLNAAARLDWFRCVVDSSHVRALKGGQHTGPSPVDRGRAGSKQGRPPRHLHPQERGHLLQPRRHLPDRDGRPRCRRPGPQSARRRRSACRGRLGDAVHPQHRSERDRPGRRRTGCRHRPTRCETALRAPAGRPEQGRTAAPEHDGTVPVKFLGRMVDETSVGAVIYALTCRLPRSSPRTDVTRADTQPPRTPARRG